MDARGAGRQRACRRAAARRRLHGVLPRREGPLAALADPTTLAFPSATTYPEPVDHCDVCRWAIECRKRRRDDDHLSLVAGIRPPAAGAGGPRDHDTRRPGPAAALVTPKIEGTSEQALVRVREQARIQLEGRLANAPRHELLLPAPGEAIDPGARARHAPRTVEGRPVLRYRRRPVCVRGRPRLSLRRPGDRRHVSAFWSRDETGHSASTRNGPPSSGSSTSSWNGSNAIRRSMSITTPRTSRPPSSG